MEEPDDQIQAHRAKLRVAVSGCRSGGSSAFNGWQAQAKELKRQRVIVTRAIMRMSRRRLAGAFYDWQARCPPRRTCEKVAVSEQFPSRNPVADAFRTFYGWRDTVRS